MGTEEREIPSEPQSVTMPYVAIYREGLHGMDRDNYATTHWNDPEVARFATCEEMAEWIEERELDAITSPTDLTGEQYAFDLVYQCKVEWGTEP